MIIDLLYRKKLGFPYVSLILIISCMIVSIPTYFKPTLYFVIGGSESTNYLWQNVFTSLFEHGNYLVEIGLFQGLSLTKHLMTNILVIAIFGVISERILGTTKFLLLTVVAAFCSIITRFFLGSFGNGISGIAWSYAVVVAFIFIQLYKTEGRKIWHDIMHYVCLFFFFMMWIVISIASEWTTILIHFVASIIGLSFTIFWSKAIKIRLNDILVNNIEMSLTNKKMVILSLLVPLFLFVLLILAQIGIVT